VVDDEPLVGRAVARLLGSAHEVVVESDGRAAEARLLAGERFDLVLCDLMMPDVTGMELHDRLHASRPDEAARLVFMTGGAFTERAREFLDRTRAPCVEKPFDMERLRALVAERIGSRG
jgi:CheY-like chemotaxis protein